MHLVVMGVSGSGKTTLARALALRLGWPYADADSFHPLANVTKMAAGVPLGDLDRAPWLDSVAAWLDARRDQDLVLALSALKRAYRDRFPGVRWVYLRIPREVAAQRLVARIGHFFSPTLLDSQLAVLEEPAPEERALTLDATLPCEAIVDTIVETLKLG